MVDLTWARVDLAWGRVLLIKIPGDKGFRVMFPNLGGAFGFEGGAPNQQQEEIQQPPGLLQVSFSPYRFAQK